METENEVVVHVEHPAAEIAQQNMEIAEASVAVAEVQAEAAVAIAEANAEAAVAIAEAETERVQEAGHIGADLASIREELNALRNEHAELRTIIENAADDVEETLREEIRAELEAEPETPAKIEVIESGEAPASVEGAERLEPEIHPEGAAKEKSRKRHFIKL